jgi:uncharacterized protein DUF5999
MCPHSPPCPDASAPDREAAHTVVSHPEQGWSLLCNGIVIFEDTGELLPDGASIAPHRPTDLAFDRPGPVGPGHGGQAPAALPTSTRRSGAPGLGTPTECLPQDGRQPCGHCGDDDRAMAFQRVGFPRHRNHQVGVRVPRDPEGVTLSVHHQHRSSATPRGM